MVKELIPEGKTTCSLCSRLRRGTLYTFADEIGATKMALGHHRDDIVETFFLNMFFSGTLKAMPPKLRADDGRNVVIRPLAYCSEKDIQAYSDFKQFPIIPCNLCGSQENLQRQVVKEMLQDWDRKTPGRTEMHFPQPAERGAVATGGPQPVRFHQPADRRNRRFAVRQCRQSVNTIPVGAGLPAHIGFFASLNRRGHARLQVAARILSEPFWFSG